MVIILNYDSSILPTFDDQSPAHLAQLVLPNSRNTSYSDYNSDTSTPTGRHDDHISIIIPDTSKSTPTPTPTPFTFHTHNPAHIQLQTYQGILHLLYTGAVVVMYPSMAQITQLKFQNKPSPFESHAFLAHTAIIAYTIAIPTSILSFYMRAHLETQLKERFYRISRSVFCFSGILAPLSLVLIMLIPRGFDWMGYLIIIALFAIIVACEFSGYIQLYLRKIFRGNGFL